VKRILLVGGLDPSGRAGLLADVATVLALKAYPLAVATTLTAQGRKQASHPVAPAIIDAQLRAALDSGPIHAIKLGVIPNRGVLKVIARRIDGLDVPTVVDPVVKSSRGLKLSSLTPRDFETLSRRNTVVTPNRHEMAAMQGFHSAVVKSLAPGIDAVFLEGKRTHTLKAPLLPRAAFHRGTGCRFASAMAVSLANGHTVVHAARTAKRVVRKFLSTPILRDRSRGVKER
jgi:hydroxymethylpyrimidine/phosphomethylpyrimidine kinase